MVYAQDQDKEIVISYTEVDQNTVNVYYERMNEKTKIL